MREFPIRFLDNISKESTAVVGDGFGKGFPNLGVTLEYYPELESIVIETNLEVPINSHTLSLDREY
jgi:hypothetical protein